MDGLTGPAGTDPVARWHARGGLLPASRVPGGDLAAVAGAADFAVLPVGAVEWHGPHLPLGADLILAEGFAGESAPATTTTRCRPAAGPRTAPQPRTAPRVRASA